MVENESLKKYLSNAETLRYADIRNQKRKQISATLRNDSFEVGEYQDDVIGCRAVEKSYGVTTTSRTDSVSIQNAVDDAIECACSMEGSIGLTEVPMEEGTYEHPVRKRPMAPDMKNLVMHVKESLLDKLGDVRKIGIVLSYTELDTGLVTSEGTNVREKFSTTDLSITLTIKTSNGISKLQKVVGGKGGMEAIQHRDFETLIDDLVSTTKSLISARRFSPLETGKKFRVILDSEAAGALSRLISLMLGADEFEGRLFDSLNIPRELEIIDNPTLPGAFGSFKWDDEGVRGRKKVLISDGSVNLLHTRLTAKEEDIPGNAHGISHVPKPSMSNVYISTSDWHLDEMINETKQGILMKGARNAEVNPSTGILELEPLTAYFIEQKRIKETVSNVKLIDTVKNILQRIDAIGKLISLIPSREGEFCTSVGGPYIRIDGARCAYSVMQ